MSNYFMNTEASILNNKNLREPQRHSYTKIYEHFIEQGKTSHALLVIPTGVGKTGIMGMLPFYISEGKVLIITPQLTVKDTVVDSLNTESHDNFWLERNVLKEEDLPSVVEYDGEDTPLEVLNMADFVILNIHKLQDRLDSSLTNRLDDDYFDMIIVDEAHHSVATTWVEAINYFSKAKVVKLTATPYRTDGRKIAGELVYEYKLSQAMANKYVKSLEMKEYIPQEISFVMDNDKSVKYSLEDVLELKDEEWVSRNVAYSPECSMQVVSKSLELLEEKKSLSNLPHMIIAVACGIYHAEEIANLYREKDENLRVGIIHSDMEVSKKEEVKLNIQNDRLDVIVNVGMLGEGYDHKYLSIAAVFRPFRSKLPYAQFIGRILRFIPEGTEPGDNVGEIVSHKYLYLEDLWQDYKKEMAESEIILNLKNFDYSEFEERELGDGTTHSRDTATVFTSDGNLTRDAYLETEILRRSREDQEKLEKKSKEIAQVLNISHQEAKKIVQNQDKKPKLLRPDKVYSRRKTDIDLKIKEDIVPALGVKYDLPNESKPLQNCRIFKNGKYRWIIDKSNDNELGMLAIYFTVYLNREIGRSRLDWELDDYLKADELLDNQYEYVDRILLDYYS